jgi:dTDP-glucose 4,6-dehydratase
MSRYAVLGGGGVFAIHFVKYLLEQKDTESVLSVGRNPPKSEAFTLGVGKGDPRYRYEQVHLVFEQSRLFELFDQYKPEYVVNFAAQGYTVSWKSSFLWYETNVVALAKVCECLMERNYLRKFLQIGTSELYGPVTHPANERSSINPTTPYAVSKFAFDMHLQVLWEAKNFPMNIIRPSNAYAQVSNYIVYYQRLFIMA